MSLGEIQRERQSREDVGEAYGLRRSVWGRFEAHTVGIGGPLGT
jgi:hypothetical protein